MTNFKTQLSERYRKYKKPAIERRRQWAVAFLGGVCVNCRSRDELEFDHIDPQTMSFRIGSNLLAKRERLELELAKCQLLCRPCHVAKSIKENSARRIARRGIVNQHGTVNNYIYYRCRCTDCKAAWSKYFSAYQRRHRAKLKEG